MASLFSHPAAPLGLLYARGEKLSSRLAVLCIILSIFPDIDVIAFRLGIPYESQWGHRGFTHSLLFSLLMGLICVPFFKERKWHVFFMTSFATFSHVLADMLTNGGLGCAIFWPLDSSRYFFPWRPVAVSPIGIGNFIGVRGLKVLGSEFLFLWLPVFAMAYLIRKVRK